MSRLFGTDGVRGVAISELSSELAMSIGKALAHVLLKGELKNPESTPHIIIGKDTRRSSDILEAALIAGITSVGADADLVGIVPTPAVAYAVKRYGADAGIMITASHNPAEFNGIKIFNGDGMKLPDSLEDEIEALVKAPHEIPVKDGYEVGTISERRSAMTDYVFDLCDIADRRLDGLNILIDCANGCAGVPAREIFANLGADCVIINNSPDGMNINKECGSTYMDELARQVVDGKFNIGISFDGDADRMLAVDEKGMVVDGDKLIALLALYAKQKAKLPKDSVVVTVMSNMGFHQFMRTHGINTVQVQVGDRYVIEKMMAEGIAVGGEQSGHIIFTEHSTTGDGMITAIKLLCLLKDRGVSFSSLVAGIPIFPQILKNVTIAPDKKGQWETNQAVTAVIAEVRAMAGPNARVLIRESGTEPLLRVMIEGSNMAEITQWADKICSVAERELS
ncbi:MAG: phosphoglucosamine mutase [Oscillospiraceae bacterium]|nr:phosphoglucosamine mutase [Oscillospiraceae bacterium]